MCLAAGSAAAQTAFLGIDDIREGWESTYGSIRSMEVAYRHRLIAFKPPPDDPNAPVPVRVMHVQRLEQQEQFHLKQSLSEGGLGRREDILEYAFDGRSSTHYSGARLSGEIRRGMTDGASSSTNALKDYMLLNGMRFRDRDEDVPTFRHYVGLSNARVLPQLESVAGVPCHVVEIEGKTGSTKIWTAHDKGFLPLKFERVSTDPVRGDLLEQRVVQETALAETDMGAFWYPTKARWVLRERNGQESTSELDVSAFVPNAPVTKGAFRIDFPPGTRVLDLIAGVQYRAGDLPDVNVSELWQATAQGTDVNQGAGGTDAVRRW